MKMDFSKKIALLAFLFFTVNGLAQEQKFTISGQITDASNGEDIPFADIVVTNLGTVGTNTNVYGFYSLTLPAGEHTIEFRYLGYQAIQKTIILNADQKISVELKEDAAVLEEVVVKADRDDQNITRNEGSITKINIRDVKELPAFGGEPDIMKVVQLNPGIKAAGEGSAGFYVRGGGLDQNLVLLDEAPVYNPSHIFGFFSVFNGDALKGATLYKGGMSAEYGGRTASVVDIRMKDGNKKDYDVSSGLGLIASRLTVEGPIEKDKSSFIISGRRTYADLFLGLSSDESINSNILYFYDLNAKMNFKVGEKDRLYFSGYFGRDRIGFSDLFGLDWGNTTATVRWNHLFSDRFFSNTTLVFSDYDYKFEIGEDDATIGLKSVIRDYNVKQDFTFFPNNKNQIKFGVNAIHHDVQPGTLEAGENSGFATEEARNDLGIEGAIYLQNEQKITDKLTVNYGLRYSLFQRIGEGSEFEYDEFGNEISETKFAAGERMTYYGGLEPRLAANYILDNKSSLKLGYNRNFQYLHLLTNTTSSSPTDVWIMSSNNVAPQSADQVSLGYFRNLKDNLFETSVEVYYKKMDNVIEYRNGANFIINEQTDSDLVYGEGESYGAEFSIRKTRGKLTGWLGYTISKTTRQFDDINNGEKYSARQDRTHDISLALMYKLNEKLTLSGNFVYYTGDATTFPSGKYAVNGTLVPLYTERNGYRMPDYHRLDLGLTWYTKKTDKFESNWNFSLYNAYGRENAYTVSFQQNEENPQQAEAVQLSLFKWVPSVTYNFKF